MTKSEDQLKEADKSTLLIECLFLGSGVLVSVILICLYNNENFILLTIIQWGILLVNSLLTLIWNRYSLSTDIHKLSSIELK
jgi:hypothetical protein